MPRFVGFHPLALFLLVAQASHAHQAEPLPTADGYHGIWYQNQPTKDEFRYKYSGGFATYPQQHNPIAVHAPAARKTFFVYGGTTPGQQELLHMVSYFDHETGQVPRPRILLNKKTSDAHDNPVLAIDADGHLWIFSNAHGTSRPAFIHRSIEPYSIDRFEHVLETNFSYGQPWFLPGRGFLFLHTRYNAGQRWLFSQTSPDGRAWSDPQLLARAEMGHYMVSWPRPDGRSVGFAFNVHPRPGGLNARTNLYYLESSDFGQTWRNAAGTAVTLPLDSIDNPALVHDFQAENRLVYLKDVQYDADGRPVLLFLNSDGYEPGPRNGPRLWQTARWDGREWRIRPVTTSDHNYDFGPLYILPDRWQILAPTDPGPQPHATGGDLVLWVSRDQGETWTRDRALTSNSESNHTYVRRPLNYHTDFASLWADGNPLEPSPSRLYFTNIIAEAVWALPTHMDGPFASPARLSDATSPPGDAP